MSNREASLQHITTKMIAAFARGEFADAQNMNVYIAVIETMSDEDYDALVAEEIPGAIS